MKRPEFKPFLTITFLRGTARSSMFKLATQCPHCWQNTSQRQFTKSFREADAKSRFCGVRTYADYQKLVNFRPGDTATLSRGLSVLQVFGDWPAIDFRGTYGLHKALLFKVHREQSVIVHLAANCRTSQCRRDIPPSGASI